MSLTQPRLDYWATAIITNDMAHSRCADWERVLAPYRGEIEKVLEIGSYEGQSALFWLGFFDCHVTCIDIWNKAAVGCASGAQVESHFDVNTAGKPVRKLKGKSNYWLDQLTPEGGLFDLIYIDGDHRRDQVMIDSILAWRVLRAGGLMIWDDYRDYGIYSQHEERPEHAIDAFLGMRPSEYIEIADTGQQMIVRKRE
jgi:predicted O-methyltransferase YrrM